MSTALCSIRQDRVPQIREVARGGFIGSLTLHHFITAYHISIPISILIAARGRPLGSTGKGERAGVFFLL